MEHWKGAKGTGTGGGTSCLRRLPRSAGPREGRKKARSWGGTRTRRECCARGEVVSGQERFGEAAGAKRRTFTLLGAAAAVSSLVRPAEAYELTEEGEQQIAPEHPPHPTPTTSTMKLLTHSLVFCLLSHHLHLCSCFRHDGCHNVMPDLAFTDTVYFDVGLCSTATKQDRTLGAKNIFCTERERAYLGRVEIGLYGNLVPESVAKFKGAVEAGAYDQTIVHKVLKGQFILAGKPGSRKYGEVELSEDEVGKTNGDLVKAKAFAVKAGARPGRVSLYLADDRSQLEAERRRVANVEFAVTTGPGPAPDLDDEAVVIGQVTKGFDVIAEISEVPTFQPNTNLKSFNKFAALLGDDRANNARGIWGKPRKAVIFSASGVVRAADSAAGEEAGPMPVP